ncbi:MAG: phage holin family protein [Hyphomicrobiales bacterium]|nr:phage holin family protein [Hyphomicrobiales bacterium]
MGFAPIDKLSSILTLARGLFSSEAALLKAELSETKANITLVAILGSVAVVFWLLFAATLVLAGYTWLNALGLPPHWSATVLAVIFLIPALILSLIAVARLKSVTIVPKRTVEQVKKDLRLLEGGLSG